MIQAPSITAWAATRPWPSRPAIEQDLLLARTVMAIYEHPYLRDELAFRGGTCLHQVRLPFTITNSWFTGKTQVLTFDPAELVATKLRALHQRKKGRDLFDLWL